MHKIGTDDWWNSLSDRPRGPIDAILRLLEQGEISRAKALELITARLSEEPLQLAPWDKLNWGLEYDEEEFGIWPGEVDQETMDFLLGMQDSESID